MITEAHLDLLTDEEIIWFDRVLKNKRYSTIESRYSITRENLSYVVTKICNKLDVFPRTPQFLRYRWKLACIMHKADAQLRKQKALVSTPKPSESDKK